MDRFIIRAPSVCGSRGSGGRCGGPRRGALWRTARTLAWFPGH